MVLAVRRVSSLKTSLLVPGMASNLGCSWEVMSKADLIGDGNGDSNRIDDAAGAMLLAFDNDAGLKG